MADADTLVLEVLKLGDSLAASISEQKELSPTLKHYTKLASSFSKIEKFCHESTDILNRADKHYSLQEDSVAALKKTGQLLWDHLLPKPAKDKLKSSLSKDLILSIDEGLVDIPWELLYDGKEFLCLKFNLGRVVRTTESAAPPQYRSLSSTPRMLILANPTNDLRSAYHEGLQIKNKFDKRRKEVAIDFKSTDIDTLYVKKNLRDYDIVHFAGHCEYDDDDYKNSGWVMADDKFSVQDILTLGETLSLPSLVFSNACQSAHRLSSGEVEADYQKKTYNLASAFLFSGVRHYIGTVRRIEDAVSLAFAKEFYTRLICGSSLGESVRLARLELIKQHGLKAISWTSYLLYGDPSFTLFRKRIKTLRPRFKRAFFSKRRLIRAGLAVAAVFLCIYLYLWLPTLNPGTYALYLKSRRLFSAGKNQETVVLSKRILGKDAQFLAVYPLLADSYHKLGKKDLALKYYFDYAMLSEKNKEGRHLASAYLGIGWIYHLQGEYPKAFDYYDKALDLSRQGKDILGEATALRRLAEWYTDDEQYDLALELLTKSSEINRKRQHIYKYKYNLACDYFDIGLVFINKDDYPAAREFYGKSLYLFKRLGLENELSDCYFNIGETYLYEKEYHKALAHYVDGLQIDQKHGNKLNLASDYIMIGELYLEMDNLADAQKVFEESVSISKEIDARVELADAYYNLGLLHKRKNQKSAAIRYLRQAQEIYWRVDRSRYREIKEELLGPGG
ncbi:CHAT domain-containing protein [Candidatus Omnitrophota bacterium]